MRMGLVLLGLGVAGCASNKDTATPLGHGYEEVAHAGHGSFRVSLEYLETADKPLMIWPSLYSVDEVVHGSVAVFAGDVPFVGKGGRGMHPRLFAVQAPALPVDITDTVLWNWAKSAHKDFNLALENFSLATPVEKDGRLELQLDFWSEEGSKWPDKGAITLDWNQVNGMLLQAKQRGALIKDPRWHTPYVGE